MWPGFQRRWSSGWRMSSLGRFGWGGGMTGRQARVCASLSGSPGWGQMIVWEWAAADTGLLA